MSTAAPARPLDAAEADRADRARVVREAPAGVRPPPALVAVLAWAGLLVVARLVGLAYVAAHDEPLAVGAVPWLGRWTFDAPTYLTPLAVAALAGGLAV